MRPHRIPRYESRHRQEEEDYDQYQTEYSPVPSASRPTRYYHSESWDERVNGPHYRQDHNSYDARAMAPDWNQNGGYMTGVSSGYDNYPLGGALYHDYGAHQQRDFTFTPQDQGYNYGSTYHQYPYYDYTLNSNHQLRDDYYPETSTSHYNGHSYSSARPRRQGYRQQNRPYHSSATIPHSNAAPRNETNDSPTDVDATQNVTQRLFQYRDSLTRFEPVRSRRDLRNTPPPLSQNEPPEKHLCPSEEYLKTSLGESETLTEEAHIDRLVRKLLVLDLNGTLVYRSPHRSGRERRFGRSGGAGVTAREDVYAQFNPSQSRPLRTAHPRPFMTSFRNYLFHPDTKCWLDTMVWSSAQPHSVHDMVEKCFGERKGNLVAIWARDKLGLNHTDYGRKVQTTKDLNKPWEELKYIPLLTESLSTPCEIVSPSPPPKTREHSAKTTLLLDDSPLKAYLQPYNHLCLKEYDVEMRKHDIAVRDLEVAREKLRLTPKKSTEDTDSLNGINGDYPPDPRLSAATPEAEAHKLSGEEPEEAADEESTRKRRRKEKKQNKKKERVEQQLRELAEEDAQVYDQTLLAVIGILDAVKRETNVAAWVRGGGLIQSLVGEGSDTVREKSTDSAFSDDLSEGLTKRAKLDEETQQCVDRGGRPFPVVSDLPLPTPLPPHENLFTHDSKDAESETERTGVPLDGTYASSSADKGKSVQDQLWYNHPGAEAYWAMRGKEALRRMKIDVVSGVSGPTG